MNSEDRVGSGAVLIEFMFRDSLVVLSLKEHLLGFFFIIDLPPGESFDQDVTFLVFLDAELVSVLFIQQIDQGFIVEFKVGDGHFDLVLIS